MDKAAILTALTAAFRKEFQNGLESVSPTYGTVAMTIPSSTATNTYAWLGKFPQMREWVGTRQIDASRKKSYHICRINQPRIYCTMCNRVSKH